MKLARRPGCSGLIFVRVHFCSVCFIVCVSLRNYEYLLSLFYFGVRHFNFIQGYIIYKFGFRSVRKSKVPLYLKYLLLMDKGWCLQAVRTAGHTLGPVYMEVGDPR